MRCRESPLLPSEVDAAVSGETSLDHESAARVGGDRPHDGHVDGDIPRGSLRDSAAYSAVSPKPAT